MLDPEEVKVVKLFALMHKDLDSMKEVSILESRFLYFAQRDLDELRAIFL